MKVKKKWKKYIRQIALACLLICCIMQWVPENVFASTTRDIVQSFSVTGKGIWTRTYKFSGDSKLVFFCVPSSESSDSYSFYMASAKPFNYWVQGADDEGKKWTYQNSVESTLFNCGHYTFYYVSLNDLIHLSDSTASLNSSYYILDWEKANFLHDNNPKLYYYIPYCFIGECLFEDREQWSGYWELGGENVSGSVNNPIEDDKEIGTPIITKRRYTTVYHDTDMGNASDGKEDIDDSQFIFDWSNKTSTGFNLKKNKYHMTRIQIKVQSKCVVYSGFSHKTVKKRFDNYGEMSSEIKSALVDDTPYSIEYGTVKSMLPKTFSEKHNPLYVGRNFTFYFRVMCNESASGTGKWHCGAWRAVGLNASTTQDQTDDSSNGHIDSDGNYTKDPDDGHNNSDSDSSTVDDKDDAKDQFKDDQKNDVTNGKNNKSFGWDDFKNLINECKQVPDLIKSVFSFLPNWVLDFIAVALFVWVFVILKKAAVG